MGVSESRHPRAHRMWAARTKQSRQRCGVLGERGGGEPVWRGVRGVEVDGPSGMRSISTRAIDALWEGVGGSWGAGCRL